MMPVPFSQVIDFLDWIASRHPQVDARRLNTGRLRELAMEYLLEGASRSPLGAMGFGLEGEIDPVRVLSAALKVFQTCPMIGESSVRDQMRHFAGCGRCLLYMEERSVDPRKAQLHPFLDQFLRFAQRNELLHLIRESSYRVRQSQGSRNEDIFRLLMDEIGPMLRQTFEDYLRNDNVMSLAHDYEASRERLMISTRREGDDDFPRLRERQGRDDGMPIGVNEDIETASMRLAESVRFLAEGDFYQEQLRHSPEVFELLRAAGIVSANMPQAIEFILWLQVRYSDLDILASAPTGQIRELVEAFCEEKSYQNVASFSKEVAKWLQGEGDRGILRRLVELGARAKRKHNTYQSSVSPFSRYQTVPYHAMFLFLSAGDFPAFIRKYWEDLNCLTGDYLDIYYSYEDVERKVSGFEILGQFRSLQIEPAALPAILLWKKSLSDGGVIPLQKLSHDDVFDVMKVVVQRVAQGKDVRDVSSEAHALVQEKTATLLPSTRIIIERGEITVGDKFVTGANINVGGIQNIGKFHDVVANLNTAGQAELADALAKLEEAVMGSQHLSDDKKRESAEVISSIGEEAAKPKPNKTLLKMLGDGLLATLKAIPDVAKAAAALAPLLAKLVS